MAEMNHSIGEKIITAINSGELLKLSPEFDDGARGPGCRIWIANHHWKPSAQKQLDSMVEAYIEERVGIRLQPALADAEKMLITACKLLDQDPRGDTIGVDAMMNHLRLQAGLPVNQP